MYTFNDYYNNEVKLSFKHQPFSKKPLHVWVICKYQQKWLLTKHKERGLEFPGGKVEKGETAKQAAIREVKEETGAVVDKIYYIGQYFVSGKTENVIKNIYFASIQALKYQNTYYETEGPVLLAELPTNIKCRNDYSFMMKDEVLKHCMTYIEKYY